MPALSNMASIATLAVLTASLTLVPAAGREPDCTNWPFQSGPPIPTAFRANWTAPFESFGLTYVYDVRLAEWAGGGRALVSAELKPLPSLMQGYGNADGLQHILRDPGGAHG